MRVYLATAYPTPWTYLPRFRALVDADRHGVHCISPDRESADLILFVDARFEHGEWDFKTMRRHPLVRARPEACFVYDETDCPWCSMPGVYVGMPAAAMDRRRQRAGPYVALLNDQVGAAAATIDATGGPTLLFSFSGRDCHPVRRRILQLRHPRGVVEDTSGINFFGDANRPPEEMLAARQRYAAGIGRSKFVLCPRGTGTASFRLFETLAAGRVPVILSDDWVPPDGPDWGSCSLRVPEAMVDGVPALIERLEASWPAMASAARRAWAEYFAPDVIWHRLIESCVDIMTHRGIVPERILRVIPTKRYLRLLLRNYKAKGMRRHG
jgi:hypothetical protein